IIISRKQFKNCNLQFFKVCILFLSKTEQNENEQNFYFAELSTKEQIKFKMNLSCIKVTSHKSSASHDFEFFEFFYPAKNKIICLNLFFNSKSYFDFSLFRTFSYETPNFFLAVSILGRTY
ncbi:hypothetical protein BpHYR1_039585, partial [Brachionus plicatilis]